MEKSNGKEKIIALFVKSFFILLFWGLLFLLPLHSFKKISILAVNASNRIHFFGGGVYDYTAFYAITGALVIIPLLVFIKKQSNKKRYAYLLLIPYGIFYVWACYELADDYKIHFGTTWTKKGILFGLVLSRWHFYFTGIISGVFFVQFYNLFKIDKKKTSHFSLYDVVELRQNFQDVTAGSRGTVVMVHNTKTVEIELNRKTYQQTTYTISTKHIKHTK